MGVEAYPTRSHSCSRHACGSVDIALQLLKCESSVCALHACKAEVQHVCMWVWHADDPEEEVLAMVVRTGLYTSMGSMVRQILSPSFVPAEKYPFLQVGLHAVHFIKKMVVSIFGL